MFNDASQFIHAPSATVLDIGATDEIELTATLIDVVGNFTNSGTIVSAGVITAPSLVLGSTAVTTTPAELNLIDGGATIGTTAVADGDGILHNDGGAMKVTSATTFKTYFQEGISQAYDDFTVGDAAVTVSTSSGNVTVDSIAGAVSIDGHTGVTLASSNSGDITLDSVADIILDAGGDTIFLKDSGTTFGSLDNTSGNLIIKSGTTTALTFSGANVTAAGTIGSGAITSTGIITGTAFTAGSAVLAEAELELLDGITAGTTAASKVFTADSNNLTAISGAVVLTEDTLSFDSTQDWDVRASPVAKVTLTANVTFDAPSNPTTGQYISILCIQDAGGTNTIAWNAVFEFTGDEAPTATTTGARGDLFTFRYNGAKWLEVGRNLNLVLS
jgi:hypothetical protein